MKVKLSNKELEVMQILWASDIPLSVSDFTTKNPTLVTSTAQAVLRSLLKKSYIEVADIVQHNKVFARTYRAVLSEKEYLLEKFNDSSLETSSFLVALLDRENDLDTLDQLEELIKKQKEKLTKKGL